MPFVEASEVAKRWGIDVCSTELERLTAPMASALQTAVVTRLKNLASEPLATGPGRIITVQDGVFVLGQPESGTCPGIEIKSVLIAAHNAPSERTMLAGVFKPNELEVLVSGLLRAAGVRANDRLIGLSDGAIWIEQLFVSLGIEQVIDVFHSLEYAMLVMIALGWDETEQARERGLWCRGLVNVAVWVAVFGPVVRSKQQTAEVLGALAYLEVRAGRMAYLSLSKSGLPIGSGQVEGMNKAVIGSRMKRSGMHWSRVGAGRMGLLRSQVRSFRAVLVPLRVRFEAFPVPQN